MNRWPRTPVFPLWSIPAFLFVYLIVESPWLIIDWVIYLKYPFGSPPIIAHLCENLVQGTQCGQGVICLAAAFYGAYRGVTFHPYFRPAYGAWLERTPWTWPMPLPLGPVHLVWEDVIAPVLLGLIALRHEELPVLGPLLISAAAYLAVLGAGFWGTGQKWYGFAVYSLLGLIIRLKHFPEVAAGVAVGTYFVSLLGLRACLAAFPWKERPMTFRFWELFDTQKQSDKEVGWPFKQLSPAGPTACVPAVYGLLVSLLAGWWLYAGAAIIPDPHDRAAFLGFSYGLGGIGVALVRLIIYVQGFMPPISYWGRVRTLRWIIPGYDQIFLAPLSIAAVGTLAKLALKHFDPLVVAPVSVFLTLLIAFNMGPTLRTWHTTGNHRMVPWLAHGGQYRKL